MTLKDLLSGSCVTHFRFIATFSLASYETYRARLKSDAEAQANLAMARSKRLILREERNFVEAVAGTFGVPSTLKDKG